MMREQLLKMVLDLYLQMDVLLSKNSIFKKIQTGTFSNYCLALSVFSAHAAYFIGLYPFFQITTSIWNHER